MALTASVIGLPDISGQDEGTQEVRFNRDIRPLLSDRCFHCHGPDEQRAKLRLDRADGPDGAYRARFGTQAIKPGSLEDSEIWYRLTTSDELDAMPPADSHKPRLNAEERETVQRWILAGAPYEEHWAFVTPRSPERPAVQDASWARQPIDEFVLRRLESAGMSPSSRADKRTLIRRLSFDLTGLPPTRAQIAEFLQDDSADADARLVDRLLASPHYGEHMAKYWLDLVRFADTNGVHHDHYRDMTPYRDWVIRAFNDNLPYDRFISDQIAGDLYENPSQDQQIASGFHRLHMIIDRGTALPEESFTRNVVDRVTAVGTAFLGLTVQCATCHDHKYDPIKQEDFYGLFAFFNNLDAEPETGGRSGTDFRRGLQPPYINLSNHEQEQALNELEAAIAEASEQERPKEAIQALRKQRDELLMSIRAAMIMKERDEIRPAHVLVRGDYQSPGELVSRSTPDFLPPLDHQGEYATRIDLAAWLSSREHPLTARVAVNRFWQQLFGVGLVKTAEDFGTQGEWPTHPELLDYLAISFMDSGWKVKELVKQIVLSATYQQTSVADPAAFASDPENRLLARGSRFRMDSEMIRDQILATSGLLNHDLYGRSVKPPQPAGIWKAVTLPDSYPRTYSADSGRDIHRRSLYTFWKRGMPPPQMSILDAPTREFCTARRERTNTPLQALLLLNEQAYLQAASHLASAVLAQNTSEVQRLSTLYETITSRLPDEHERQAWLELAQDLQQMYSSNPSAADELCQALSMDRSTFTAPELAAWTLVVNALYNLDITKTRD